jgi:hypothetical protein
MVNFFIKCNYFLDVAVDHRRYYGGSRGAG